jgi:PEP-CTERM motif
MMKVAGVLAFAVSILVFGVTEAPAVAFDSGAGLPGVTCAPTLCPGGFVAITPDPAWQPNNTGPSTGAAWVSFANTGNGGSSPLNVSLPLIHANATESFTVHVNAGFSSLNLLVWADDTAGVSLNGGTTYLNVPDTVQGAHCAATGVSCTGPGTPFAIPLGGLAADLTFDVFQRAGGPFGLMFAGDLTPTAVPEPTTMLLVGSALAAAGFASRRRLQKKQGQLQS